MLGKLIAKKAGRPKRRRGPKPKPKKVVAKKAPVRKNNKKPLSKRAQSEIEKLSGVKLTALKNKTPSEQREYLKTISDRAEREDPLPRRRATGPEGSKPVEQGPLLSKVQLPEKMSKAQARKLIMQGKAKVRTDKNGKKKLVSTGEHAPARGVVAEEMGLSKRGKLPSEAELKEMGGFEMRKTGGKAKPKVRRAASAQKRKNPKVRLASNSNTSMIKPIASESSSRKGSPSFSSMITKALKKFASPEGQKRIEAAGNPKKPKKPKSDLSPREYLKQQAKIKDIMRNDVEIVVNKPKKPAPSKKRSPIPKSDNRYLNDYRIEKTAAGDNYKTSKKTKPKFVSESGLGSTPIGTEDRKRTIKSKPKKRKTVGEAMFSSDQTPRNQTVKNPFTGNDMTIDYSDNYEMKMGGKVRRRMGGKVRGYGKAQRGY